MVESELSFQLVMLISIRIVHLRDEMDMRDFSCSLSCSFSCSNVDYDYEYEQEQEHEEFLRLRP